ncbi:GtrA family protein [Rhizobium sp. RU36D]|uniref:GtrA family protein n=1 Tax=Rhizobium sp. RU36D TaxID=1907415 RepID=UPI0009D85CEF|nr:GtrA family protein [Rhizobium sp. RU36D]SMD15930.1 GtrA-like protein [Rhizobium sp. RU36D]
MKPLSPGKPSLPEKWTVLSRQVINFLIVGGSNFLLTYVLYIGLLLWASPLVSYIVSTVFGILYVVVLNMVSVFKSRFTVLKFLMLFAYNVAYTAVSIAVFRWIQRNIDVSPVMYPVITQCILLPLHFLCTRFIAQARSAARHGADRT